MEVWKIIFLSKWVICRFYVNLLGGGNSNSFLFLATIWGRFPILTNIFRMG